MKVLVDTHALLWATAEPERLGRAARDLLEDVDVDAFVSVASVWEAAIKCSLGKLSLSLPLPELVARHVVGRGFRLLPVEAHHALAVERLPWHHRDPFDRLLVAQAALEGLVLISRDEALDPYGVRRVWDSP